MPKLLGQLSSFAMVWHRSLLLLSFESGNVSGCDLRGMGGFEMVVWLEDIVVLRRCDESR